MAQSCRRFSSWIGAGLIALGVGALIGWIADVEILKCVIPGTVSLKVNSAVCFVLMGLALVARQQGPDGRIVERSTIAATLAVAAATLFQYTTGRDLGIDEALFVDPVVVDYPGRMATSTALGLLLGAGALSMLSLPSHRAARFAQTLAITTSTIGVVRFMSFATIGESHVFDLSATMSVHASVGITLLGIAILLAAPERGYMTVVVADGPGGSTFRRLSVPAFAAPPTALMVSIAGIERGLFDVHYALALSLASLIPMTFVSMWRCARDEEQIDAKRRAAEQSLAASEARFKLLSESSPVGVFLTDEGGRCTYTNPRWSQLSGIAQPVSLDEGWLQAVHPEDRERVSCEWHATADKGGEFRCDFRFLTPSEEVRWVHAHATPTLDSHGAVAGYVGTIADMTERRASEQLRTDLVSMLSHDLRNPLTVIIGFTEHLIDTLAVDEADRGMLQRIEANAKIATNLASNFVDAMRIEAGKLEVRRRRLPLSQAVRTVVDSEATLAKTRGVLIETIEAGRVPEMLVDRGLLERALGNLVSNAVKFSPPGGRVQVTVDARSGEALITVSDEGPGVEPPDQSKLFQRFGTLAGSKPDSTGLGLFIVKTIAEAHGGSVAFSAPPHGGAAFTITLPLDN